MTTKSTIVVLGRAVFGAGCLEDEATGPSGSDVVAERARLKGELAREVARPGGDASGAKRESVGGLAVVATQFLYDAVGRRDPFEPYRAVEQAVDEPGGGPLEQFELEQLSVVALVWSGPVGARPVGGREDGDADRVSGVAGVASVVARCAATRGFGFACGLA